MSFFCSIPVFLPCVCLPIKWTRIFAYERLRPQFTIYRSPFNGGKRRKYGGFMFMGDILCFMGALSIGSRELLLFPWLLASLLAKRVSEQLVQLRYCLGENNWLGRGIAYTWTMVDRTSPAIEVRGTGLNRITPKLLGWMRLAWTDENN